MFEAQARPLLAYLRSQRVEDPDGAVNEVFLRAFRNLDRFQGDEAAFRSWLFVIARNFLIDERRRQHRRPAATPTAPDAPGRALDGPAVPAAEHGALVKIGMERVHGLLDSLSADQRDVLLLRIVADLTVVQVAAILGKEPGAVKQLQRRGIEALRRRLENEPLDPEYPWTANLRLGGR